MKQKIIIENGTVFLPGAKAVATSFSKLDDATIEKVVIPKDFSSSIWSPWGDDNLFPQNVLKDLEKNSIALRALEKRKTVHYGRGILAYRDKGIDSFGAPIREVVKDPEVVDFLKINHLNFQWIDLIGSLEIFANGWIEFILNKNRDKINKVFVKDPAYCRHAKMDPLKPSRIPFLFYSAQWDMTPSENDGSLVKIPMYDPARYDGTRYTDPQFAYPVYYRSFNKSYYHLSVWNGIRESGWLSIANKVPQLKQAIMRNQMTIKYHIEIPDDYFSQRYPSPDYTKEEREAARLKVLGEMNDFLSDIENSGKAFVSFSFFNKFKGEYLGGWKINVIDNKLRDDAYLPDSQAANSEILFAIGVDPCLVGSGLPGGNMGSGSGSDKREAFWQLNAEMGIYRQISLEPLYFIRDFNKWSPDIDFDYVTVDTSQTMQDHPTKIDKRIDKNIA
jgi:hypothetical protein